MNEKATLLNKMPIKRNIYLAIFSILLISFLIAGATYAYFIDTSATFENVFTAGTVDVNLDPENTDAHVTVLNGCEEYRWQLKNVGTKSSYVRVKAVQTMIPADGETAWALGGELAESNFSNYTLNSFRDNTPTKLAEKWGWYFRYIEGDTITRELWAGAGRNDLNKGEKVGTVTVSTDSDIERIEVVYNIYNGWTMSEAHFYIGGTTPPSPVAPGSFDDKDTDLTSNTHTFYFPLQELGGYSYPLYMAAHAVVAANSVSKYSYQPSTLGDDCLDDWFWYQEGDDDGYWYYWNYSQDAMKKVVAGDELELCLLMCPLGSDNSPYKFHIEIEAIQSSNEAYVEWPEGVWENLLVD